MTPVTLKFFTEELYGLKTLQRLDEKSQLVLRREFATCLAKHFGRNKRQNNAHSREDSVASLRIKRAGESQVALVRGEFLDVLRTERVNPLETDRFHSVLLPPGLVDSA